MLFFCFSFPVFLFLSFLSFLLSFLSFPSFFQPRSHCVVQMPVLLFPYPRVLPRSHCFTASHCRSPTPQPHSPPPSPELCPPLQPLPHLLRRSLRALCFTSPVSSSPPHCPSSPIQASGRACGLRCHGDSAPLLITRSVFHCPPHTPPPLPRYLSPTSLPSLCVSPGVTSYPRPPPPHSSSPILITIVLFHPSPLCLLHSDPQGPPV